MTTLKRLTGLIYHSVELPYDKGYELSHLDVGKILNVRYDKRAFCIFDKDRPYILEIVYKELHTNVDAAPVISGGFHGPSFGLGLYDRTHLQALIRYRGSQDEIYDQIRQINDKMKRLDEISQKFRDMLLADDQNSKAPNH
jgi:hypothetical protein